MKNISFTSPEFTYLFSVTPDGKPQALPADNIPIMHWPDGTWCYEVNIYLFKKFQLGRSRRARGGTLYTYATQLSHIVGYCFNNRVDFSSITDAHFTAFITFLKGRRSSFSGQLSSSNTVLAIGRCTLDFLAAVALMHGQKYFIGEDGQIRAIRKTRLIKIESTSRFISKQYWDHASFPKPSPLKKIDAITKASIDALILAATNDTSSLFIRRRRYILIRLLEITGGRRDEIRNLTVNSVMAASEMESPKLRLITVKQGGNEVSERFVPITMHDCKIILDFIEKSRLLVIRKTIGLRNDHGFVIVSETTGKQFAINTITQEVRNLKIMAGLANRAHPHMFRHRFITKLFISYIRHFSLTNRDEFRRRLLDTDFLKRKVMELTGHRRSISLDRYIDPAFDEYFEIQQASAFISSKSMTERAELVSKLIADVKADKPKEQIISDLQMLELLVTV